jgi:hypothetical protein
MDAYFTFLGMGSGATAAIGPSVGSFSVAGPFSEEAWLRKQETFGPDQV